MAAVAFATFFATIGPFDLAALLAALTPYHTTGQRRSIAFRGVMLASVILMIFALLGNSLLEYLGISLAALRISGGILLFLLSISMVFGEQEACGPSSSEAECFDAMRKEEISVFPLAMPLIAGPASMSAAVLLMAAAKGVMLMQVVVIVAMLSVLALTLVLLMAAGEVQKILGVTGIHMVRRTVGFLLSAFAVQFMLDGLLESGLFR